MGLFDNWSWGDTWSALGTVGNLAATGYDTPALNQQTKRQSMLTLRLALSRNRTSTLPKLGRDRKKSTGLLKI